MGSIIEKVVLADRYIAYQCTHTLSIRVNTLNAHPSLKLAHNCASHGFTFIAELFNKVTIALIGRHLHDIITSVRYQNITSTQLVRENKLTIRLARRSTTNCLLSGLGQLMSAHPFASSLSGGRVVVHTWSGRVFW